MNERILDLAKQFIAKKEEHATIKAELDEVEKEWTAIEIEMQSEFTELGVKTVNLEGLGAFTMSTENYFTLAKANEEEFFKYMKAVGHGGLIKETVHSGTMKSFLKEHLEEIAANELAKIHDERSSEYNLATDDEEKAQLIMEYTADAKERAVAQLIDRGCSNFSKKQIKHKPENKKTK